MYKRLILTIVIALSIHHIIACNVCGCSSSNFFLGPTPSYDKYFFGIRYAPRRYSTILSNDNTQFSKDFYQTAEFWAGIKIKKKFQLMAFLPFNINRTVSDDGSTLNNGFGDITVIGSYNVLDHLNLNKDTQSVSHQLWLGIGAKIPTGKFSVDANEVVSSANSQAGTGSLDFLATATYTLVIGDNGLTNNLNYKYNEQASGFRFGNRFTATSIAFHTYHPNGYSLSPNIGLMYENLNPNELDKVKIASTGGTALLATAGLESQYEKIMLGFNIQLPIMQNLSDSQTKINWRGMLHVTYAF